MSYSFTLSIGRKSHHFQSSIYTSFSFSFSLNLSQSNLEVEFNVFCDFVKFLFTEVYFFILLVVVFFFVIIIAKLLWFCSFVVLYTHLLCLIRSASHPHLFYLDKMFVLDSVHSGSIRPNQETSNLKFSNQPKRIKKIIMRNTKKKNCDKMTQYEQKNPV